MYYDNSSFGFIIFPSRASPLDKILTLGKTCKFVFLSLSLIFSRAEQLPLIAIKQRKKFFALLPSHPHTLVWKSLFIVLPGGEGKCEGRSFIPHTYKLHPSHLKANTVSIKCRRYFYAAPKVQGYCTKVAIFKYSPFSLPLD